MASERRRERPQQLNQEPEAVTFARERAGLTKRDLARLVGTSEQLMGEIESGWRNATFANLCKIAAALNCPVVFLERKHPVSHGGGAVGAPELMRKGARRLTVRPARRTLAAGRARQWRGVRL